MALSDLILFPHFLMIFIGIIFLTVAVLLILIHKPNNWRLLHEIFTILGFILVFVGLILLGVLNLLIIHGILGLISFLVLIITLIIGLIAIKLKKKRFRNIHIWVGRIIYLLVIITTILGIILFL